MRKILRTGRLGELKSSFQRATVWPSALTLQRHRFLGTRRSGRQKIEKRTYLLEVLALKVPFRNLPVFPNQVPWPGRLENSTFSEYFDAGRTREIQQIRPAATLLLSVNCLYQMNKKNCKGEFKKCISLLFGAVARSISRSIRGDTVPLL